MSEETTSSTTEGMLAERLGVSRDQLAEFRQSKQLLEGVHWARRSNWIMYLPAGEAEVRVLLSLPPAPEKKEGCAPGPVSVRVISHPRNPALLMADMQGKAVRVRLKPVLRKNLGVGKVILVRAVGDPESLLFELHPSFRAKKEGGAA